MYFVECLCCGWHGWSYELVDEHECPVCYREIEYEIPDDGSPDGEDW